MIVIIDYGLGNLASVANALSRLSIPFKISNQTGDIQQATGLILPGVGAAGAGMKNLRQRNLDVVITEQVASGKPLLGICLGMQLFFSFSEEGGVNCLDLINGEVQKLKTNLKVPQVGWNQVNALNSQLLQGITNNSYFYFVHSYYCNPIDTKNVTGVTNYGQDFCSVIESKNIYGVQFHPEKSGEAGLQVLENFWRLLC